MTFYMKYGLLVLLLLVVGLSFGQAEDRLEPDVSNEQYGPHERNVLDVWFADTTQPTPLVIYIHGGGFVSGSKDNLNQGIIRKFLDSGIAVAAVNYRFLENAPLPAAHMDVLRALQYIRSMSEEWNLDKSKIGAFGGSAGAQLSLWLAFSDEMANPTAEDPVERASSRLWCVATSGAQTTLNMGLWRDWIPEFKAYNITNERMYGTEENEAVMAKIESLSALSIVSEDDPPVYLYYKMRPDAPVPLHPNKAQSWKIHHVNFGIKLKERMDELGVEAHLDYPGSESIYQGKLEFFKAQFFGTDE